MEGEERECPGEIPRVDLSSTLSSSVPLSAPPPALSPSSIVAECQGRSSAVGRSVGRPLICEMGPT